MNVSFYQLVTGEKIITQVEGESSDFVTMKNPMVVIYGRQNEQQTNDGRIALNFMPFIDPFVTDQSQEIVTVNRDKIVYDAKPNPELENEYRSKFSGIVTATEMPNNNNVQNLFS